MSSQSSFLKHVFPVIIPETTTQSFFDDTTHLFVHLLTLCDLRYSLKVYFEHNLKTDYIVGISLSPQLQKTFLYTCVFPFRYLRQLS